MKLLDYKFQDKSWNFDQVKLGSVNLFVGASGSGKSRLFNTIFNVGRLIATGEELRLGTWHMRFAISGQEYVYDLRVERERDGLLFVDEEHLLRISEAGVPEKIIDRTSADFTFRGNKLPKLSRVECSLHLLREEDDISPITQGFGRIQKRDFSSDGLQSAKNAGVIKPAVLAEVEREKSLENVGRRFETSLNSQLLILKRTFPRVFEGIVKQFISVFPFVSDLDLKEASDIGIVPPAMSFPVVAIRERAVAEWIALMEWSSGMTKVLVMLVDLAIKESNWIYMVDEYENSLGVNAIDVFPSLMLDYQDKVQFLIISHHPYLINRVPIDKWHVFGRRGGRVAIKYGNELRERYGVSKQQAFTQLLNDPFFQSGEE